MCCDQVPDVGAVGRDKEADACEDRAADGSCLTEAGPSFRKEGEQKGHREIHHTVGCGADDTGCLLVSVERPVARVVLLEDAITHGKT